MNASRVLKVVRGAALVVAVAAFATGGQAAEPVSSSYILGKLVPITGQEDRSIDLDITFELNSARLSANAKGQLDALGQALVSPQLGTAKIGIYGHTDASGAADFNKTLSEKRAESVKVYLVGTFKIDPMRLDTAGYGEEKLKNPANPRGAENRRVEIVNLTPNASRPMAAPSKAMPSVPAPAAAPIPSGGMQSIQ